MMQHLVGQKEIREGLRNQKSWVDEKLNISNDQEDHFIKKAVWAEIKQLYDAYST